MGSKRKPFLSKHELDKLTRIALSSDLDDLFENEKSEWGRKPVKRTNG